MVSSAFDVAAEKGRRCEIAGRMVGTIRAEKRVLGFRSASTLRKKTSKVGWRLQRSPVRGPFPAADNPIICII